MLLSKKVHDDEREEFRRLANQVASYYQQAGCDTLAYDHPSLPHFSMLTPAGRAAALAHIRATHTALNLDLPEAKPIRNNTQALWASLRALNLTPPGDLFSRLEQDDLIELYEPGGLQLWRNLGVMEICSYTIEEMHSFDWAERYERKASDTAAIFSIVAAILQGGSGADAAYNVPMHFVRERFSRRKFLLQVDHGDFIALRGRKGEVGGILVRSKGRVISEGATALYPPPRLRLCSADA